MTVTVAELVSHEFAPLLGQSVASSGWTTNAVLNGRGVGDVEELGAGVLGGAVTDARGDGIAVVAAMGADVLPPPHPVTANKTELYAHVLNREVRKLPTPDEKRGMQLR